MTLYIVMQVVCLGTKLAVDHKLSDWTFEESLIDLEVGLVVHYILHVVISRFLYIALCICCIGTIGRE